MNSKKKKLEITYLLGKNKQEYTVSIIVPDDLNEISAILNITKKLEEKYGMENVQLGQIKNF